MIGLRHRNGVCACVRASVRPSVTRVNCGQTRGATEFIFARYLPLDNSNPIPKWDPPPPERMFWGPKYGVLWEGIGQLWAIAMKFGTKIPLPNGNTSAKFGPDRLPNGGVMGPQNGHWAQILAKCVDCGQTVWRISFIFGRYLPQDNINPHPKGDTSSPEGTYGAPKFWVVWEGIGQLWAIAMKFGRKIALTKGNMAAKFGPDRPPNGG